MTDTIFAREIRKGHIIKASSTDYPVKVGQVGHANGRALIVEHGSTFTFGIQHSREIELVGTFNVNAEPVVETTDSVSGTVTTVKVSAKSADKYSPADMRKALVEAKYPVGARGRLSPEQKAKAIELLDANV